MTVGISQRVIGRWVAGIFDRIITVNPHLHRTMRIEEVFPGVQAVALDALPLLAKLLSSERVAPTTVVIGPDAESRPWMETLAHSLNLDGLVAEKHRFGDRDIELALPSSPALVGRPVMLVDDVASTGTSLMTCARRALDAGASHVEACVVHALYPKETARDLAAAGIARVRSTDSVAHPTNAVELAPSLAAELQRIMSDDERQ